MVQRFGDAIVIYCGGGGGGGYGSGLCRFGAVYIMIPPTILSTAATMNKYDPRPKPQFTVVEPTTGKTEVVDPPIGLAEIVLIMVSTWLGML